MIEKINVTNPAAIHYFKKQLSLGGKTLSVYLSSRSLEEGKIYSFVPEGTARELLYSFDSGGIYPSNKVSRGNANLVPIPNDVRSLIVDLIYDYLKVDDNCCIFEEASGFPEDPWVKASPVEYVRVGNEMYYYFNRKRNHKEKIEKALVTSDGYYFLCALGKLSIEEQSSFTPKKEISQAIMKRFVGTVKFIIVKAYDGEGYLIWEKE